MIVYRIAKAMYANDLSASGRPNRWNPKGDYVLYTSVSRSLATLELLVHRSGIPLSGIDFRLMTIEISEGAAFRKYELEELSTHWRSLKGYSETQSLGHSWVESRQEIVLEVPSAVVPEESNFIINTEHPQFHHLVQLKKVEVMVFDERLG